MSASSSDVCVIGGGVIGLATAASLGDRGVDVVCFERSEPGQGQSAGPTRQFRHLHRAPELIDLAVRARRGWVDWEQRFGRRLLGSEGALRTRGGRPGPLSVAAPRARTLLWDPLAGVIRASDTVATLASCVGSWLRRAEVTSIAVDADGESVEVRSTAGVHRSARCVVCAGAGTDRLVRARLGRPSSPPGASAPGVCSQGDAVGAAALLQ